MTREEITNAIAEISEILKGPGVSNLDRRLLHEDRKDLRAELAKLDAASQSPSPTPRS